MEAFTVTEESCAPTRQATARRSSSSWGMMGTVSDSCCCRGTLLQSQQRVFQRAQDPNRSRAQPFLLHNLHRNTWVTAAPTVCVYRNSFSKALFSLPVRVCSSYGDWVQLITSGSSQNRPHISCFVDAVRWRGWWYGASGEDLCVGPFFALQLKFSLLLHCLETHLLESLVVNPTKMK